LTSLLKEISSASRWIEIALEEVHKFADRRPEAGWQVSPCRQLALYLLASDFEQSVV